MAKQLKTRASQPLVHAFNSLAQGAANSIAFHEAVLASSAVVRVTYTLTTTPGLAVEKIAFGFDPVDLTNDQDPTDQNVFKTRNRDWDQILCIDDKLMIEVETNGADGNSWSLEVTVDGQDLPASPIKKKVNASGFANHAALHQLP